MASNYNWWEDRALLAAEKITVHNDILTNDVIMYKQWNDGSGKKFACQLRYSYHALKHLAFRQVQNSFEDAITRADDYVNPGPTNLELKDPRLARIWEEYKIVRNLIGVQKS